MNNEINYNNISNTQVKNIVKEIKNNKWYIDSEKIVPFLLRNNFSFDDILSAYDYVEVKYYWKYHYPLIVIDYLVKINDKDNIDFIINNILDKDTKYIWYRKKLWLFLNNIDEKEFWETLKKINKRKNILLDTRNLLWNIIENYSYNFWVKKSILFVKKYNLDSILYSKFNIILWQFKLNNFDDIINIILSVLDENDYPYWFEQILYEYYNFLNDKNKKIKILDILLENIDKIKDNEKVKWCNWKFDTEYLWRIWDKYIDLGEFEKAKVVIKLLWRRKWAKDLKNKLKKLN